MYLLSLNMYTQLSELSNELMVVIFIYPQATVLEEMPPFPERESSILAKLKKKKQEKAGIVEKEEKAEPAEKPTTNGQVPVANEVRLQPCQNVL